MLHTAYPSLVSFSLSSYRCCPISSLFLYYLPAQVCFRRCVGRWSLLFQNKHQQDDTYGLSFISRLVVLYSTCFELQGAHYQEFTFSTLYRNNCNDARNHECKKKKKWSLFFPIFLLLLHTSHILKQKPLLVT